MQGENRLRLRILLQEVLFLRAAAAAATVIRL
jgi:hypothetical protein